MLAWRSLSIGRKTGLPGSTFDWLRSNAGGCANIVSGIATNSNPEVRRKFVGGRNYSANIAQPLYCAGTYLRASVDVNAFFRVCCTKVIMSGVNGNVIMSGCRNDNPDDERREAARSNTKSVSRGTDGGGGRDGDRSQRAAMLPDQRSGKRAPYTTPFSPRSASKASLPAGISGQSQCGWGHTVGSVGVK